MNELRFLSTPARHVSPGLESYSSKCPNDLMQFQSANQVYIRYGNALKSTWTTRSKLHQKCVAAARCTWRLTIAQDPYSEKFHLDTGHGLRRIAELPVVRLKHLQLPKASASPASAQGAETAKKNTYLIS